MRACAELYFSLVAYLYALSKLLLLFYSYLTLTVSDSPW